MGSKLKTINPFTDIPFTALPEASTEKDGQVYLSNLKEMNIGDGGTNVFRADEKGIWLGGKTFDTAVFSVSMAGDVVATSMTITGGTLKYGKTSFTDNTHDGYYIGAQGIYAGKAADATIFKFTIADGSLEYTGKVTAAATSDIPATTITGSITASQIGSVNATAISGSITAGQIQSITAGQITGSITAGQIDTITAGQITGSITASQIGSVNATAITGMISAGQITSITAAQITGSITSSQIGSVAANTITGAIVSGQIGSVNASVINGVIVSSQLADQIINNLSLFATDLRPIKQVTSLPTLPDTLYPIGATVYLTTDAKLYRNAGGAWSASAAAADLTGTLTASQIGSVNATSITGLILAAQISSITAGQITGQIQASQINTIAATQITGSITASQIGSVNASAITGGITSSQITSVAATAITGSITASQISSVNSTAITGSITSGQITSITAGQITGQITGTQIADLTISASKLANGTITAAQIANLTITASQISNLTINDTKIASNAITNTKISNGAVTYDKISVTTLSAITANLGTITAGTISGVTLNITSDINLLASGVNVLTLNANAFIARHTKAFAAESSTAGVYTQFYTAGLNGIIQITDNTSGSFGIKDDTSSNYFMKWTYWDTESWKTILPMVAGLDLGSAANKWDDVFSNTLKGNYGEIWLDQAGRIQFTNHCDPTGTGTYNLGGATRYWGDVSYKTLTDRGCLGWFDEGVELQDGRIVSDIEALKAIQKHPTKLTIYGKPMLDYKTLPKVCYKPATDHDGKLFPRDENDEPYLIEKDKAGKKVTIKPQDGAEMTSMFSIMIGAFKEVDARLAQLEAKK